MKVSADKMSFTTFKDDVRIFKAAKFLRKYKIDELAQLFNVFKADMSIVLDVILGEQTRTVGAPPRST